MKLHILLISSLLALAACGGNSTGNFGSGGGGGEEGEETGGEGIGTGGDTGGGGSAEDTCAGEYVCSGTVRVVSYNDGGTPLDDSDDILSITATPFDESPLAATYVRAAALDVPGYKAFTNDDPLQFDVYIAYHETSPDGEVSVGLTGIEGYFEYGYSGTFIDINDPASIPSEALVQFEGQTAGLIAFEGIGTLLQSYADVILQVDTTDGYAKGFIVNRTFRDPYTGNTGTQNSLVLNDTTISGGTFSGTANSYKADGDVLEGGSYTGYFVGDSDIVAGEYTVTGATSDVSEATGFSDPGTVYPVGDNITARDQSVFITYETPHGPNPNPFLP